MKNTIKGEIQKVDSIDNTIDNNRRSAIRTMGLFAAVPFISGAWIGCGDSASKDAAKEMPNVSNFSTDLVLDGDVYTASHWGALKVSVKGGKIVKSQNAFSGLEANPLQAVTADLVDGKYTNRIKAPMVRKSYLEKQVGNNALRGADEWVEVSYEQAIKIVSDEIKRVRSSKGPTAIYGGSYGWKSSGNMHNARTLLHRFLNLGGGFVGGLGDYSTGAAQVIMPHVVGTLEVYEQQTAWPLVLEHSKVVVIWGANPADTLKIAWSSNDNQGLEYLKKLRDSGKKIICIDPAKSSTVQYFGSKAEHISVVPNTDVALMLGIIHTMLASGKYDQDFIANYTEGFEKFQEYVLGKSDKIAKDAKWASEICGVSESKIKELAQLFFENRTMIMGGWNMQRQHHGEQAHWMLVVLSSMIGQIGLPGGGFGFSYHYSNGGAPTTNAPVVGGISIGKATSGGAEWLSDGSAISIPVARVTDMLANPGKTIQYNGKIIKYPEIDLVYWAGGNPFVHHQDTNALLAAWRKPTTVVVHDMYWTPTAKMADIVFPITTPYERNDITMSGDYSNMNINPMKQVVAPFEKAKSDYQVFSDLAEACGFGAQYTEGKTDMDWIEEFYNAAYENAQKAGVVMADGNAMPDFKTFWNANRPLVFDATPEGLEFVRYADFREDPILNPLGTPSGKIEIYSTTIEKMNYKDCKAFPQWFEPAEWKGMKDKSAEFALLSPHPSLRLHSQLANTRLRDEYAVSDREPIWINPADAEAKGIKNGDIVRAFNKRGQILVGAVVSDIVPQGVVRIYEGAWYDPQDAAQANTLCKNGNANVLTMDIPTSELSNGNSACTAMVNIEKYTGTAPKNTAFLPPKGA